MSTQESNQFPRRQMTDAQWREFAGVYLRAFETMPRKEAYAAAVRKMRTEGKVYPAWGALLKRLRGVGSVTIPEPAPESSDASESSEPSEAPSDKSALALDLLRCYRFRRERDFDALTDRLFPELGN